MALHFDLRVNGQSVGFFYARRTEELLDEDQVSTYEVEVSRLTDRRAEMWTGKVEHRYSDGAWALVAKALAEMRA